MFFFMWDDTFFYYTDYIKVPLGLNHRFPMEKYELLRLELLNRKIISSAQLIPAPLASIQDILLAHSKRYVEGIENGTLPTQELRLIGLPWSNQLYQRSLAAVGGFIHASESALRYGFSALLAGGTHHAHQDKGEGFCIFNDFAVAALKLLKEKKVSKILILDLDVHQGNGNSSLLGHRKDVFVCSLHGEKNYPFKKIPSHLDFNLPPRCEDREFLNILEMALEKLSSQHFDLVFYQSGVDGLKEDRFGTLSLSLDGLRKRDEMVFSWIKRNNIPCAMAIGGGYATPITKTIEAYAQTFMVAKCYF
jgi:acetoin utilization deacetylase AcuC-like enzyme